MKEIFEMCFSHRPDRSEAARARRELPEELRELLEMGEKKGARRIVLDPDKSGDAIKQAVVLGVEPDAKEEVEEKREAAGELTKAPSGAAARVTGTGTEEDLHIGLEKCVRITIGFIFPCGKLRVGGCYRP